jgi:hypothetical protein
MPALGVPVGAVPDTKDGPIDLSDPGHPSQPAAGNWRVRMRVADRRYDTIDADLVDE